MFFNQFLDRKKTKNLFTSTNISINDTRNISECTPINNNKNIQKINPYSVKLTIVLHPVFSAIIPAGN